MRGGVGSKGTPGRREQGTVEYRSRLAGEDMPRKPLLDEAGQAATIPSSHPRIGTYHRPGGDDLRDFRGRENRSAPAR